MYLFKITHIFTVDEREKLSDKRRMWKWELLHTTTPPKNNKNELYDL